jgi:hypothetical protein
MAAHEREVAGQVADRALHRGDIGDEAGVAGHLAQHRGQRRQRNGQHHEVGVGDRIVDRAGDLPARSGGGPGGRGAGGGPGCGVGVEPNRVVPAGGERLQQGAADEPQADHRDVHAGTLAYRPRSSVRTVGANRFVVSFDRFVTELA